MEEIRSKGGVGTLRKVTEEEKVRVPTSSREELLDQIRCGVSLKKVEPDQLLGVVGGGGGGGGSGGSDNGGSTSELSGIAGMLHRALQERTAALCQSSSSSDGDNDDDEDDDDEWD